MMPPARSCAQSIITKAEGGHEAAVHAFQSYGTFLFSADRNGTIKVWDLNTGAIAQTINQAHSEAVTQMLMWEVRRVAPDVIAEWPLCALGWSVRGIAS